MPGLGLCLYRWHHYLWVSMQSSCLMHANFPPIDSYFVERVQVACGEYHSVALTVDGQVNIKDVCLLLDVPRVTLSWKYLYFVVLSMC